MSIERNEITEETLHLVEVRTPSGTICIEDLGFDYDTFGDYQYINNQSFYHDAQPVNIDRVISVLQKLKEEGANYVECNFHEDHQELEVTGYAIRLATDAEITEYYNKQQKLDKDNRDSQILKLEMQLKQLKGE